MVTMKEMQERYFIQAFLYSDYNCSETARILGVAVKTVFNWVEKLEAKGVISRMDADEYKEKRIERNIYQFGLSGKNKQEDKPRVTKVFDMDAYLKRYGFCATNEERLAHADNIINRDWL